MIATPATPPEAPPAMVFEYDQQHRMPVGILPENIAPNHSLSSANPDVFKVTPAYTIQTGFEGEPTAVAESKRIAGKTIGKIITEAWKRSENSIPTIFIQDLPRTETPDADHFSDKPSEDSLWLQRQLKDTLAKQAKRKHVKAPKINIRVLPDRNVDARRDRDVMDDLFALSEAGKADPSLGVPNFGYMQSAIKQGKVEELPALARQVYETSTRNNGILAIGIGGVSKTPATYVPPKK